MNGGAPDIHELIPGLHMLRLGSVQAYLGVEADRLTLIDAGLAGSAQTILDAVRHVGRRPEDLRQIVATHCHRDHVGALAALAERTGARVMAHRLDAPVIRGDAEVAPPDITDAERPYYEQVASQVAEAPPARVDHELEDGDEIDLDGGAVVVGAPGHTPGSIAVYVPRRRALFTGDAAATFDGNVIAGAFHIDRRAAQRSFARLAALDFDVACFGHGEPLGREASLAFRRVAERYTRAV